MMALGVSWKKVVAVVKNPKKNPAAPAESIDSGDVNRQVI